MAPSRSVRDVATLGRRKEPFGEAFPKTFGVQRHRVGPCFPSSRRPVDRPAAARHPAFHPASINEPGTVVATQPVRKCPGRSSIACSTRYATPTEPTKVKPRPGTWIRESRPTPGAAAPRWTRIVGAANARASSGRVLRGTPQTLAKAEAKQRAAFGKGLRRPCHGGRGLLATRVVHSAGRPVCPAGFRRVVPGSCVTSGGPCRDPN